jgi:hypothetical protein
VREKDQEIDEPGFIIIASSRCAPTYSATHRNCLARGHRRRQRHCSNSQKGQDQHHHPLPRSQWSVVKENRFFGGFSFPCKRATHATRENKQNTPSKQLGHTKRGRNGRSRSDLTFHLLVSLCKALGTGKLSTRCLRRVPQAPRRLKEQYRGPRHSDEFPSPRTDILLHCDDRVPNTENNITSHCGEFNIAPITI